MNNIRDYEGMFVIDGSKNEQEIKQIIEDIKSLIAKYDGKIIASKELGKRRMSYEIGKQKEGFYALFLFKIVSSAIAKIEQALNIKDGLFRNLIILKQGLQEGNLDKFLKIEG